MSAHGSKPVTYETENGDTVEVYSASDGWRGRRTARNGRNVGNGSEGYARKDGALRAARRSNPARPRIR